MFFTFVSWCVLGGARLRGRVARSSVAVAYGGAVARLGEWSARLWLPVAVLRVACVGLAGYFLWSPGPLERLGFAGESLWFYDAVAWAVACSAVSFAVSLHGFVVRRVLRAIAIAGLLALVPIAVFAGAAYLHFSLDVFDPVRVVQFRVAWDEGHSVNRWLVLYALVAEALWLWLVVRTWRRMDRVGDRVAGWFRSGARLAFRLALPVAVAVLAVQASEGGLDALLVWTSAAADQALGWARPYFPAAVAYVEGDPGRLRVAEFAAGVVVGGAVVGVGAQLVDLVRVMAGEYVLRLRVRAEASNTFALVSGSADESADGEPRGGVGYRALTREC